jgi:hypothetical protein
MVRTWMVRSAAVVTALAAAACSGKPSDQSLRDSFAQQVSAIKFIKDFQRNGDDLTFSGPGSEGGVAKWRIHIDAATIENNNEANREAQPYKGTIHSSWYSDGQLVKPSPRDSNLPIELMSNGLSQECWAMWDKAANRWSWE